MEEEHEAILKKMKNRKAAGSDKIPSEVWKTKKNLTYFSDNAKHKREMDERRHPSLSQER